MAGGENGEEPEESWEPAARPIALLGDPARLDAMEAATAGLFAGDAAARIVADCEKLLG